MANTIVTETITGKNWDGVNPIGNFQIHAWMDGEYSGNVVDHIRNLDFETITRFSHGLHLRSGAGNDVFNFVNISNVKNTIVGRFEDFDPTRDKIQINGVTLDFNNLPSNVRVVSYNGDHNDLGAIPQQWLLIDTGEGHIFYALEGARVDMNGDGGANDGDHEAHFIASAPDFASLQDVVYRNPFNFVPAGFEPDGGIVINDFDVGGAENMWRDRDAADVEAIINGTTGGDLIAGGLNDDTVHASAGNDRVWGGDGNDNIFGQDGRDTLNGNAGNDSLNGGVGADVMAGGAGDDLYWVDHTDDLVQENPSNGWDQINSSIGVNLDRAGGYYSNVENVKLVGAANVDAYGSSANNTLTGNTGTNLVSGRAGNDQLAGGAGADTFLFRKHFDKDTVTDFENNVDTIRLLDFGFTSYAQAQAYATQSGADVIFDFGNGDTLTVRSTTIAALADDMIFS